MSKQTLIKVKNTHKKDFLQFFSIIINCEKIVMMYRIESILAVNHCPAPFNMFFILFPHFFCLLSCNSVGSKVPLICETKPAVSTPHLMNCHNNGNYPPPSSGSKHEFIPPDVARLMQLEEGIPPTERKKPPIPPRHLKKSKERCTIDMNGLETNV